jgi:hypothetical protein
MADNRIDATLSQADRQDVLDAINTIRTKLPFLIDLTTEERRFLPKMGDKSQAFVTQALTVAEQNPDVLPRSFDVAEMRRDVELAEALRPVMTALTQLQELVEDTYLEIGSEAYTSALMIYSYMRAGGKGAALDEAASQLGQRFARKTKKAAPSSPDNPQP